MNLLISCVIKLHNKATQKHYTRKLCNCQKKDATKRPVIDFKRATQGNYQPTFQNATAGQIGALTGILQNITPASWQNNQQTGAIFLYLQG